MVLREKTWFPIFYMFAMTLVLSAVIILFGSLTRKRVEDNQLIAFERAVLEVLPIERRAMDSPSRIHAAFSTQVKAPDHMSAGAFRLVTGNSLVAYVLPIEGPGFWAQIKGVIGIMADTQTVTGIAFYEQNETPGLGGEIVKTEFTSQFVGKRLRSDDPAINVLPVSATLDEHSVHAVTGATQTSIRLAKFLNETIKDWRTRMEMGR